MRLLLDRVSGRYFAMDEEIVLLGQRRRGHGPRDTASPRRRSSRRRSWRRPRRWRAGAIRCYGQSTRGSASAAARSLRQLANALSRGEMSLHYQPLVEGPDSHITAAEALLRWDSPELGSIPPAEFVPLAEELGLMVPIGTSVLRTACTQVRRSDRPRPARARMRVNVSLCQLIRGDFAQVVADCLQDTGIDASLLELSS